MTSGVKRWLGSFEGHGSDLDGGWEQEKKRLILNPNTDLEWERHYNFTEWIIRWCVVPCVVLNHGWQLCPHFIDLIARFLLHHPLHLSKSPLFLFPASSPPAFLWRTQLDTVHTRSMSCLIFHTKESYSQLQHPRINFVVFKEIIAPKSVARGIKEIYWPGKLSFHTGLSTYFPHPQQNSTTIPCISRRRSQSHVSQNSRCLYHLSSRSKNSVYTKEGPNYQARRNQRININKSDILSLSHSSKNTFSDLDTWSHLFSLRVPISAIEFGC